MAWTYDDTDLTTATASGRLNSTRLLLGDTDINEPLTKDSEVVFALSESSDNVYKAASWLARSIASKYSREVNVELDGILTVDYSTLAANFTKLADQLEYQAKTNGAKLGIYAGGLPSATSGDTNFRMGKFWNPPKAVDTTISYE
jgi:hypothetical protein